MTGAHTDQTRILLFTVAGLLSGIISGLAPYYLPDVQWVQLHYPAVILGVALYLCGSRIARLKSNKPLLSLLALIMFSIFGWRISIDVGYFAGGPVPFVTAGALGAFIVAWGWLLAWGIPTRDWKFILSVTLAGMLGGLIFQFADAAWEMKEPFWALILFSEWQCLLLAGIAFAHQRLKL